MAILRTWHVCPTMNELVTDMNEATVFRKTDLRSGYHQLVLYKQSRYITTFSTRVGLYQYKRLIFGVTSAAEVFQHTIQSVIESIKGARNVSDDIIVFGKHTDEHNLALKKVLHKLHKPG